MISTANPRIRERYLQRATVRTSWPTHVIGF